MRWLDHRLNNLEASRDIDLNFFTTPMPNHGRAKKFTITISRMPVSDLNIAAVYPLKV